MKNHIFKTNKWKSESWEIFVQFYKFKWYPSLISSYANVLVAKLFASVATTADVAVQEENHKVNLQAIEITAQ